MQAGQLYGKNSKTCLILHPGIEITPSPRTNFNYIWQAYPIIILQKSEAHIFISWWVMAATMTPTHLYYTDFQPATLIMVHISICHKSDFLM